MEQNTQNSIPSNSFFARASSAVAANPKLYLGVIVLLAIMVIALLVYYRGIWFLGPYSGTGSRSGKSKLKNKKKTDDSDDEQQDTEDINKLVAAINN